MLLVTSITAAAALQSFSRGSDLLQLGEKVSSKDVANVLGRWKTHGEWDSIGKAAAMDDFSSGDYYEEDLEVIQTDYSKGEAYYLARRPQRRAFCKKYDLVQRWVHSENVGSLPFTDEALAASVGATVQELNDTPINPIAAEVVFDALCQSKAGFVKASACDAQRSSFTSEVGAFDADAFGRSLQAARWNILGALAVYPGLLIVVGLAVAIQVDLYHLALDAAARAAEQTNRNVERFGVAPLLIPLPIVLLVGRGLLERLAGRAGGVAEQNVRESDRVYAEVMRLKKSTGGSDADAWSAFEEKAKARREEAKKKKVTWTL